MTALKSQPSVAVRNPNGGYDGPDDQWMPDNAVALAEIKTNYAKRLQLPYQYLSGSNSPEGTYLED